MRIIGLTLLACVGEAGAQAPPTAPTSAFAYILSVDVGWPDMSWPDAEAQCKKQGFYLARILSQRDQDLMLYKLDSFTAGRDAGFYTGTAAAGCSQWPCGMWIGANDREQEGQWKWTNGVLLSEYGFGGVDDSTGGQKSNTNPSGTSSGLYPWGGTALNAVSAFFWAEPLRSSH